MPWIGSSLKESPGPEREAQGLAADPAEREWVRRAQDGDRRAFEALYRRHVGWVYALCLRLLADPVEAEILTQDSFVRAWTRLAAYREEGPFGAWLRRLALNLILDSLRRARRQARRQASEQEELDAMSQAHSQSRGASESGAPDRDAAVDLERAIRLLPPAARQVFVLHDVHGFKQQEIAEMTCVALGTVKSQLHRARRLVREQLASSPPGSGA